MRLSKICVETVSLVQEALRCGRQFSDLHRVGVRGVHELRTRDSVSGMQTRLRLRGMRGEVVSLSRARV